jgi:trk system potassium uptake protein
MKQFAIIGLDIFGKRMLDELLEVEGIDLIIIDKDKDVLDRYKNKVSKAYLTDVIDEEAIKKLISPQIDGVIIDLGAKIEASILVTNYLKKIGVQNIIAKAESEQHGEILDLAGAKKIVFPNKEAAKRITPLLVSPLISSYLPISNNFVIAEVKPPLDFIGRSLIDLNLRQKYNLNVIGFRKEAKEDYAFFSPDYTLQADDIFLLAGNETDVVKFAQAGETGSGKGGKKGFLTRFFSKLIGK